MNYEKKAKDELWFKKERERGREKYRRLNYKDKSWNNKTRRDFRTSNSRRELMIRGYGLDGKEAHHWNYNLPHSILLLSPKAHHRIHRHVQVNREDKFLYTLEGKCLDTEEKTIAYYKDVLGKYDDLNENIEIINY